MRAFITLCLLATAYGEPQGYSYQQQQQQSHGGFQIKLPGIPSAPAAAHPSNDIQQGGSSFLQEALQNTKVAQTLLGAPQNSYVPPSAPASAPPQSFYQSPPLPQQQQFSPNFQQSAFGGSQQQSQSFLSIQAPHHQPQQQQQHHHHHHHHHQQQQQQQYQQLYQPPPVVTKDIYVHVAPEEPEEKYTRPPLPVAPPRKHYRIVFIKAPTPTVSPAAVHVKQAPTEEKTIIYVLTKKPDPLDLQAAIQDVAPKPPTKPEVYFIKYRTQEEAQHAQRTIQAQYDQLGGTTQVSDEGVAPVTSVIGSLDQQQGAAGAATGPGFSGTGSGSIGGIGTGSGNGFTSSGTGSGTGSGSIGGIGGIGTGTSNGNGFTSSGSISGSDGGSIGKYLPPIATI